MRVSVCLLVCVLLSVNECWIRMCVSMWEVTGMYLGMVSVGVNMLSVVCFCACVNVCVPVSGSANECLWEGSLLSIHLVIWLDVPMLCFFQFLESRRDQSLSAPLHR